MNFAASDGTEVSPLCSERPVTCPCLELQQSTTCGSIRFPEDPQYFHLRHGPIDYAAYFNTEILIVSQIDKPLLHITASRTIPRLCQMFPITQVEEPNKNYKKKEGQERNIYK